MVESSRVPIKRVVPLLLLSHGCGLLGGFLTFSFLFHSQCAELMQAKEERSSIAIKTIQSEYDSRIHQEIVFCQRQQLVEQNSLLENHHYMLKAHQSTLLQLTELQNTLANCTSEVDTLKDESIMLKLRLQESDESLRKTKQWAVKQQDMHKSQLSLTKTMMQERIEELETYKRSSEVSRDVEKSGTRATSVIEQEFLQLQSAIRRRSLIQTKQFFGKPPTYRVQVVLAPHINQPSTSHFEVELGALQEMPHTVLTFLSLVDAGLYQGTSITLSSDASRVTGGNPKSAVERKTSSRLLRKYADLAFGSDPLLFTEVPLGPCGDFAFGIVGRGPDFLIQADTSRSPTGLPCIGRVVAGQEALSALPTGDGVTIVDISIIPQ